MNQIIAVIQAVDRYRRSRNTDWVFLVTGPRGAGKSNLSLWCATQLVKPEHIIIVNTAREFLIAIHTAEQYSVVVYDEGLRGLMSRQAMSTENIEQIKAFAQMRQNKNLIIFVVTQDLSMMERHIRTIACDGIFRCTFMSDNKEYPTQGMVLGYGPRKILKIKSDSSGQLKWPDPDFADTFPSIEKTELWKKYEQMEGKKKVQSSLDGLKKLDAKYKKPKTEAQLKKEVEMEQYMYQLKKKKKSIARIQQLVKRKYKKHYAIGTIFNKLKKMRT